MPHTHIRSPQRCGSGMTLLVCPMCSWMTKICRNRTHLCPRTRCNSCGPVRSSQLHRIPYTVGLHDERGGRYARSMCVIAGQRHCIFKDIPWTATDLVVIDSNKKKRDMLKKYGRSLKTIYNCTVRSRLRILYTHIYIYINKTCTGRSCPDRMLTRHSYRWTSHYLYRME